MEQELKVISNPHSLRMRRSIPGLTAYVGSDAAPLECQRNLITYTRPLEFCSPFDQVPAYKPVYEKANYFQTVFRVGICWNRTPTPLVSDELAASRATSSAYAAMYSKWRAFIGEYYAKFVPSEPVTCPCGEPFQTRVHILRECETYAWHREILQKVSEDISMPEILATEKGLQALALFLEKTGAFTKTGRPRATEPLLAEELDDESDDGDAGSDEGYGGDGGETEDGDG
ncbi:hypothetical protein B0H13DRAFT_2428992 [Mycena leptocephala]|nr:hypothetical protein B0H13DRAFT_2428992 [Mycena leptocephala]